MYHGTLNELYTYVCTRLVENATLDRVITYVIRIFHPISKSYLENFFSHAPCSGLLPEHKQHFHDLVSCCWDLYVKSKIRPTYTILSIMSVQNFF